MNTKRNENTFLAFLVSLLTFLPRRKLKSTNADLAAVDFKTSTQAMGVTITDRIRNVFRFRWIRNGR